jgi:tellurite resistance protein TehA-like permease
MTGRLERVDRAIRHLPPGAFAFVMATGIVSTAFLIVGWVAVSVVLLWIALAGLVAIAAALVWRLMRHPDAVLADVREPGRAFGYFTIVAAINVIGVRLFPIAPVATIVLGALSVPLWILLTYGVPAALILGERSDPVAARVDGSWFLWVVGTQSLATAAAAIGQELHTPAFAAIAVALWGIGIVLYLMLATLVTLRLLTTRNDAASLGPGYWIYMGATAITVLAGSRILVLPPDLPILVATAQVVSGLTFVLWAFGVWWVPLLVIFGVWRHGIRRVPLRYENGLWSIVFPLGMYSVASMHFGAVAGLPLVATLGRYGTWASGVAWLAVVVAMMAGLATRKEPRSG